VSFADKRNLQNAMDASSDTSISMKSLMHTEALQDAAPTEALQDAAPLLSSAEFDVHSHNYTPPSSVEFDFHSHNYIPPSLLQQVFIFLRLKASSFRYLCLLGMILPLLFVVLGSPA
jgi:hypothetical protein